MNRKLITLLAILIAVTNISAVSAFDFGSLFGSDENKTVNINGMNFNVSGGFQENTTNAAQEAKAALEKQGLNVTTKIYMKDSKAVGFYVSNYTNLGLSSDQVLSSFNGSSTTIKNITGFMREDEGAYIFSYTKDGCVIFIISNDKNLINDVLIA